MDNTFVESLNKFMRDKLRNVHTVKPCVVTKVTGNRVSVKPLTATKYHDGSQFDLPILDDVPLMIYSANMGGARITVPIVKGDTVIVLCSDRDTGDMMNTKITSAQAFPADEITPLELYPIMAIPCFYTIPSEKPISTTDIVIENGSTKVTIKPSGDIDLDTTANVNVDAGGDVDINAGGSVNVSGGDTVNIDTPVGVNVTSPSTVFSGPIYAPAVYAPIIAPSEGGDNLNGHVHDYTDVGATPINQVTDPAREPTP